MHLDANTRYWITIWAGENATTAQLAQTRSNSQTGASGWNIGDGVYTKQEGQAHTSWVAQTDLGTATATGTIENRRVEPLTARFEGMPAEHDGSVFTFDLSFSENLDLSYATLRDDAFSVTGGDVRRAKRKTQGSNQNWSITIEPTGTGNIRITLPETTNCNSSGAICTNDGRKLSHSTSDSVDGPVGISVGDVEVAEGADTGRMTSAVTGLYPWVGFKASERVTVWTVAGYGAGGLLLDPGAGAPIETGLSMAAGGGRGELMTSEAGFELAFKADALWVGTRTDAASGASGNLKATRAGVTRLRTALEGSKSTTIAARMALTPSVEIGIRQDGGDAEVGRGVDVGLGLMLADGVTGLAVDVRIRRLLVHQADGFAESGMSIAVSYDPTPKTPLGFTARVSPAWGGDAMSGADALWGRETMSGMGRDHLLGGGGNLALNHS